MLNQTEYLPGPNIERKLESAVAGLNRLVTVTESTYSFIYDVLPELEQEVNLNIREVEILLDYLIYNSSTTAGSNNSVTMETLLKMPDEFEQVIKSFLNKELIVLMLQTFLNNSSEDKQSFAELIRVVNQVEETLSVLRDIALNSIIFSVRIGNEGAAFQILSDRINHVSLSLGQQFRTMKETIGRLIIWNEDFQKSLSDFVEFEEKIKDKYENKFRAEIERVGDVLKTACGVLKNNLDNTDDAFHGVSEIMVMIQNQDIIRQNIENMAKCLEIVLDKKDSAEQFSVEKQLDYVVFANKVMELSQTLLENIEDNLTASILEIQEKLSGMYSLVLELEEDSGVLSTLLVGNEGGDSGVLGDIFKNVIEHVIDLIDNRKLIESKSGLLGDSGDSFIDLMGTVERDFEAIDKEANQLKKMKVLIQIELARINLETDFTLNSIISAIDQVIDTIRENQRLFLKLRGYFTKNIDEFNRALNSSRSKLESSTGTLQGVRAKLDTTGKLAKGAVSASSHEMKEIFAMLKQPHDHLSNTESLVYLISDIKTQIGEIHNEFKNMRDNLFRRHGIEQWEEKEEDLRLLTEQFTCSIERKVMTAVTGNETDIGSAGGDIVLF